MEANDIIASSDEKCVLQYLENFPDEFVTETEITRRADGKSHFLEDSHWAHVALSQLLDSQLLETDGTGKYRVKKSRITTRNAFKKFIAPHLRDILEHSKRKLDLSGYEA
jgi:hypothetical protein